MNSFRKLKYKSGQSHTCEKQDAGKTAGSRKKNVKSAGKEVKADEEQGSADIGENLSGQDDGDQETAGDG